MVPVRNSRNHVILRRSRLNAKIFLKMHFSTTPTQNHVTFLLFWKVLSYSEFNSASVGPYRTPTQWLIRRFASHASSDASSGRKFIKKSNNWILGIEQSCWFSSRNDISRVLEVVAKILRNYVFALEFLSKNDALRYSQNVKDGG